MSKSSYPLKLPHSVKEAAQRLAKADGVSSNQFIASAVAEKIGTLNTVHEFLKDRAGSSTPSDMHQICFRYYVMYRMEILCLVMR